MRLLRAAAIIALATAAFLPAQKKPPQNKPPFVFNKSDLKVLEECAALDRRFETRALVFHDAAIEEHFADLTSRLRPAQPLEHVAWNLHILRNPTASAFALPNGSIYLDTGLLARAENDDQVFGTLAHEIAHVTERHAYLYARSLRKSVVGTTVFAAGSYYFTGIYGFFLLNWAAGRPDEVGLMDAVLGYRRDYEEQADQSAVEQMKKAGRDPVQLARFSLILDEKIEPQPIPFLRHDQPVLRDRVNYLKRLVGVQQDPGPGEDGGYVARVKSVILQDIQLDLNTRQFRSAVAGAQRLQSASPNDALAIYWLGESYRSLGPRDVRLTGRELKPDAQRTEYREEAGRSEQEEAARLAATPEGKAALVTNQRMAEDLFRQASGVDPSLAEPYFGLGALYEQQGKREAAVEAYRKYIELCPQPADRERAKRRVDELTRSLPGTVK